MTPVCLCSVLPCPPPPCRRWPHTCGTAASTCTACSPWRRRRRMRSGGAHGPHSDGATLSCTHVTRARLEGTTLADRCSVGCPVIRAHILRPPYPAPSSALQASPRAGAARRATEHSGRQQRQPRRVHGQYRPHGQHRGAGRYGRRAPCRPSSPYLLHLEPGPGQPGDQGGVFRCIGARASQPWGRVRATSSDGGSGLAHQGRVGGGGVPAGGAPSYRLRLLAGAGRGGRSSLGWWGPRVVAGQRQRAAAVGAGAGRQGPEQGPAGQPGRCAVVVPGGCGRAGGAGAWRGHGRLVSPQLGAGALQSAAGAAAAAAVTVQAPTGPGLGSFRFGALPLHLLAMVWRAAPGGTGKSAGGFTRGGPGGQRRSRQRGQQAGVECGLPDAAAAGALRVPLCTQAFPGRLLFRQCGRRCARRAGPGQRAVLERWSCCRRQRGPRWWWHCRSWCV